jgi:hypothetical protein
MSETVKNSYSRPINTIPQHAVGMSIALLYLMFSFLYKILKFKYSLYTTPVFIPGIYESLQPHLSTKVDVLQSIAHFADV